VSVENAKDISKSFFLMMLPEQSLPGKKNIIKEKISILQRKYRIVLYTTLSL
jgi:hypothetical protein